MLLKPSPIPSAVQPSGGPASGHWARRPVSGETLSAFGPWKRGHAGAFWTGWNALSGTTTLGGSREQPGWIARIDNVRTTAHTRRIDMERFSGHNAPWIAASPAGPVRAAWP